MISMIKTSKTIAVKLKTLVKYLCNNSTTRERDIPTSKKTIQPLNFTNQNSLDLFLITVLFCTWKEEKILVTKSTWLYVKFKLNSFFLECNIPPPSTSLKTSSVIKWMPKKLKRIDSNIVLSRVKRMNVCVSVCVCVCVCVGSVLKPSSCQITPLVNFIYYIICITVKSLVLGKLKDGYFFYF